MKLSERIRIISQERGLGGSQDKKPTFFPLQRLANVTGQIIMLDTYLSLSLSLSLFLFFFFEEQEPGFLI